MLKDKLKFLTFLNLILILLIIVFLFFDRIFSSEKIVYIDNQKLFDNFQMTKDLKQIGEIEFNSKKKEIDSLYSKVQGNLIESEKETLVKLLISKREEFDNFNQTFGSTETLKIWSRIDTYVEEFSKDKNYDIIISADSKRDVLYVNKKNDITPELLEFINKKYEGTK